MKKLKQYIIETLNDPHYGEHLEVKIPNYDKKSYLRPDWLYTFENKSAIIIEDKEQNDSSLEKAINKLNNIYYSCLQKQGYKDIITIACKQNKKTETIEIRNFRNKQLIDNVLHNLKWYKSLLNVNDFDNGEVKNQEEVKRQIYPLVKEINQILHDYFQIKNLQDRMLYTGCLLIASKWSDNKLQNFDNIKELKKFVGEKIDNAKGNNNIEIKNSKLRELKQLFNSISIGTNPSSSTIRGICENCNKIIKIYEGSQHCDVDIMNIFFIEFNRYRGKSEHG